jgi:hypothetical protein
MHSLRASSGHLNLSRLFSLIDLQDADETARENEADSSPHHK